jgi:hypothetical protein
MFKSSALKLNDSLLPTGASQHDISTITVSATTAFLPPNEERPWLLIPMVLVSVA